MRVEAAITPEDFEVVEGLLVGNNDWLQGASDKCVLNHVNGSVELSTLEREGLFYGVLSFSEYNDSLSKDYTITTEGYPDVDFAKKELVALYVLMLNNSGGLHQMPYAEDVARVTITLQVTVDFN